MSDCFFYVGQYELAVGVETSLSLATVGVKTSFSLSMVAVKTSLSLEEPVKPLRWVCLACIIVFWSIDMFVWLLACQCTNTTGKDPLNMLLERPHCAKAKGATPCPPVRLLSAAWNPSECLCHCKGQLSQECDCTVYYRRFCSGHVGIAQLTGG